MIKVCNCVVVGQKTKRSILSVTRTEFRVGNLKESKKKKVARNLDSTDSSPSRFTRYASSDQSATPVGGNNSLLIIAGDVENLAQPQPRRRRWCLSRNSELKYLTYNYVQQFIEST